MWAERASWPYNENRSAIVGGACNQGRARRAEPRQQADNPSRTVPINVIPSREQRSSLVRDCEAGCYIFHALHTLREQDCLVLFRLRPHISGQCDIAIFRINVNVKSINRFIRSKLHFYGRSDGRIGSFVRDCASDIGSCVRDCSSYIFGFVPDFSTSGNRGILNRGACSSC